MDDIDELFQRIYGDLNGAYPHPAAPFPVENAFAEGEPCMVLYKEVYDCRIRVSDRLDEKDDPDLDLIVDKMLEIAEILSRKMFEYGIKVQESRQ